MLEPFFAIQYGRNGLLMALGIPFAKNGFGRLSAKSGYGMFFVRSGYGKLFVKIGLRIKLGNGSTANRGIKL